MGLATARALAFSLDVPLAGVSTLAALAAGAPEALAVIDARRGEVFVLDGEPRVLRPEDVDVRGRVCVGDGAVRYRVTFEEHGAEIPPDADPVHVPARALPRAAGRALRPRRRGRAGLPARSRREAERAVTIRRLQLKDLAEIERIERESYATPWSRSMFAGELSKASSVCLGALDGDEEALVGYLIVSRYVDAWHVMNIAVDPARRRAGVAIAMLERLFELTVGDGRRGYTLEVRVSNHAAINLYQRLGFQPRGIRRGYYTDNREDALIMWRDPQPQPVA